MTRADPDTKYLYSDVEMSGRKPPLTGEWLVVDDALEHIQTVALAAPTGVEGVRWSPNGWPPLPPIYEREPGHDDLGPADNDVRERAVEAVRRAAVTEFGISDGDDDWRRKVPVPWLVRELRDRAREAADAGWDD